jgi:hypothetical protein
VSVILERYRELRAKGLPHGGALRNIATELRVDTGTVHRILRRAQGLEERERRNDNSQPKETD